MHAARRLVPGWPAGAALVRVVGDVVHARVEVSARPENVDHVWFTVDAGLREAVEISVNTRSRRNAEGGFDPRIRLGRLRESSTELPGRGVEALARFDYTAFEPTANVFYEALDRREIERLLIDAGKRCARLEIVGTPYHRRRRPGVHQIHSRRASSAVKDDHTGLDGALRFHFDREREAEWWFFKFCGQP